MPDIETSVVISAQTDQLQSGLEAAANSVEAATDAMRAQFAGLGVAAQQAQMQISTASAQVGSSIGALQAKAASIAGSVGDGMIQALPSVAAPKSSSPPKTSATSSTGSVPIRRSPTRNSLAIRQRSKMRRPSVSSRRRRQSIKSKRSSTSNGPMTRPITKRSWRQPTTMAAPKRSCSTNRPSPTRNT